ncbi:MAG: hypothetical protein LUC22_01695 [Prevotella sp.]|nr:hypothetical protein [Prevotella sp.]
MLRRACLLNLIAVLALCGCGNTLTEYSSVPCYVVVDNSLFLDATLASAMNSMSPGIFCMIQKTMSGTAEQFSFSATTGLSSTQVFTAKEQQMNLIFGMNNGIIVGFGNIDSPATFYAYDRECPNCFDPNAVPVRSKPLSLSPNGQAACAVCGRIYDMNNRGYIISGDDGDPLTRYPASTSGPYGVLVVQ